MTATEIQKQKDLLNVINYKGDESFYKLSSFVVSFITLIRSQEDENEWKQVTPFETHKEEIKRRKSKSEATFQKYKEAILADLDRL